MTAERNFHGFSNDRPIESKSEDKLDRALFAAAVANAIRGWNSDESLVIALYGEWGVGKTSVKNMILESLRADTPTKVDVLEFNPWQMLGPEQLTQSFFDDIGSRLGKEDRGKGIRVAAKWESYAAYLNVGTFVSRGLQRTARAILSVTIALTVVGASIVTNNRWKIIIVLAALALLAVLSEWSAQLTALIASVHTTRAKARERNLSEIKGDLRKALSELSIPLLIVLDDVDRLSKTEIALLLQLVKANADFPNLIFLLLFQRSIIENSLDSTTGDAGRRYLEKIVQVGFNVPPIERVKLDESLFEGLDTLLASDIHKKRFDSERWNQLYYTSLREFFTNLRDVRRFLSTLEFHIGLFSNGNAFEVNPNDLIALETLRTFEPEVYLNLSSIKTALTSEKPLAILDGADAESTRKTAVQEVIALGSPTRRNAIASLIRLVFPNTGWMFDKPESVSQDSLQRRISVAHAEMFDRYFLFAIPRGDISQAEVDGILAKAADRNALALELRVAKERGRLDALLARLHAYKEAIPIESAVPFITAIFDVSDALEDLPKGIAATAMDMVAIRIVYWYLKTELDPHVRASLLSQAMAQTTGLYLPVRIISLETPEAKERDPDERLVPETDLRELEQVCVRRIERAAESGELQKQPHRLYLLYRWAKWGGDVPVKTWISRQLDNNGLSLIELARELGHETREGFSIPTAALKVLLTKESLFQHLDRVSETDKFVEHDIIEALANVLNEYDKSTSDGNANS